MTAHERDARARADAALFDYDAELYRYHARLRSAMPIGAADHVLDIGCGAGQTTREAARAAVSGSALGVDISAPMLTRARRLSREAGLRNLTFVQADAQDHRFPHEYFDIGISRFGTMFFTDPIAAFTNVARALRPGARLVQMVWQASDLQEWDTVIGEVFPHHSHAPPAPGSDPCSLASPATTVSILTAAGFTGIDITDVHEPVCYGPDTASALDALLTLKTTRELLAPLDAARTGQARAQLRAAIAAHETSTGVYFDSRAWIITAHRS